MDVFCLDPSDHEALLQKVAPLSMPKVHVLEQQELRSYHSRPGKMHNELACLCHYAEGRTLLLDTDGLYNSFLETTVTLYEGNVFLILCGIDSTPASTLCDMDAVSDLIEGGQVSVAALCDAGRFFTCSEFLNEAQLRQLKRGLRGELQPFTTPPGVIKCSASARPKPKPPEEGGFKCMILWHAFAEETRTFTMLLSCGPSIFDERLF